MKKILMLIGALTILTGVCLFFQFPIFFSVIIGSLVAAGLVVYTLTTIIAVVIFGLSFALSAIIGIPVIPVLVVVFLIVLIIDS